MHDDTITGHPALPGLPEPVPGVEVALTPAPRRRRVRSVVVGGLLAAARPLLGIHFEIYRREMSTSIFPRDECTSRVEGPRPESLAFVGSVAVAGLGVLSHGMTTSSQTAQRVAANRRRGMGWTEVSSPVLTAETASTLPALAAPGTDVAVLLLGIADVLTVTSPASWERSLRKLIERARREAGHDCAVVVAELPPMADFRPIPPLARRLITAQIARLDAVVRRLAREIDGVTAVPFPAWDLDGLFVQDLFSWASMHRTWAEALAPHVSFALDSVEARRASSSPLAQDVDLLASSGDEPVAA